MDRSLPLPEDLFLSPSEAAEPEDQPSSDALDRQQAAAQKLQAFDSAYPSYAEPARQQSSGPPSPVDAPSAGQSSHALQPKGLLAETSEPPRRQQSVPWPTQSPSGESASLTAAAHGPHQTAAAQPGPSLEGVSASQQGAATIAASPMAGQEQGRGAVSEAEVMAEAAALLGICDSGAAMSAELYSQAQRQLLKVLPVF